MLIHFLLIYFTIFLSGLLLNDQISDVKTFLIVLLRFLFWPFIFIYFAIKYYRKRGKYIKKNKKWYLKLFKKYIKNMYKYMTKKPTC